MKATPEMIVSGLQYMQRKAMVSHLWSVWPESLLGVKCIVFAVKDSDTVQIVIKNSFWVVGDKLNSWVKNRVIKSFENLLVTHMTDGVVLEFKIHR